MKFFLVFFLSLLMYGCGNGMNEIGGLKTTGVESGPWFITRFEPIPSSKGIIFVILENRKGSSLAAITNTGHSLTDGQKVSVDIIRYDFPNMIRVPIYIIKD